MSEVSEARVKCPRLEAGGGTEGVKRQATKPQDRDVVVRVGQGHNRHVVVLRDYLGTPRLSEKFLTTLQRRLEQLYGDSCWKVGELDYFEVLR